MSNRTSVNRGIIVAIATGIFAVVASAIGYAASVNLSPGQATAVTLASTAPSPPAGIIAVHVNAISGSPQSQNKNQWHATVTITVVDASGSAVAGATVDGSWSPKISEAAKGCGPTAANGTCSFTTGNTDFDAGTEQTWTVSSITGSGLSYNSIANAKNSVKMNCDSSQNCTNSSA